MTVRVRESASGGHEKTIGSKGKGLWGMPGKQLPAAIQRVYNDLVESGRPKGGLTYRLAVGIVRNWSQGHDGKGNKVSAKTQAAGVKAMAEWEKLRGEAHARSGGKRVKESDDCSTDDLVVLFEAADADLLALEDMVGGRTALAGVDGDIAEQRDALVVMTEAASGPLRPFEWGWLSESLSARQRAERAIAGKASAAKRYLVPFDQKKHGVGTHVVVDDEEHVIEGTSRYAGGSRSGRRVPGTTVRPKKGGRARVVANHRIQGVVSKPEQDALTMTNVGLALGESLSPRERAERVIAGKASAAKRHRGGVIISGPQYTPEAAHARAMRAIGRGDEVGSPSDVDQFHRFMTEDLSTFQGTDRQIAIDARQRVSKFSKMSDAEIDEWQKHIDPWMKQLDLTAAYYVKNQRAASQALQYREAGLTEARFAKSAMCPHGHIVDAASKRCPKCGAEMPSGAAVQHVARAAASAIRETIDVDAILQETWGPIQRAAALAARRRHPKASPFHRSMMDEATARRLIDPARGVTDADAKLHLASLGVHHPDPTQLGYAQEEIYHRAASVVHELQSKREREHDRKMRKAGFRPSLHAAEAMSYGDLTKLPNTHGTGVSRVHFDPAAHHRDAEGKFTEMLVQLHAGLDVGQINAAILPNGVGVRKSALGKHFEVFQHEGLPGLRNRDSGVTKVKTAREAARLALSMQPMSENVAAIQFAQRDIQDAQGQVRFDPTKHPRDAVGHFSKVLDGLVPGLNLGGTTDAFLPNGIGVYKSALGGHFIVHDRQDRKVKVKTSKEAARIALSGTLPSRPQRAAGGMSYGAALLGRDN